MDEIIVRGQSYGCWRLWPPPPSPPLVRGRTHSLVERGGGVGVIFWKMSDTALYSKYVSTVFCDLSPILQKTAFMNNVKKSRLCESSLSRISLFWIRALVKLATGARAMQSVWVQSIPRVTYFRDGSIGSKIKKKQENTSFFVGIASTPGQLI
jgi:hypothetical protein